MAVADYDFTLTRQQIIEAAFKKMNILSAGDVLTAEMSADGVLALNLLIKQWNSEGIYFWGVSTGLTQSLPTGTTNISLTNDPFVIGVDQAYILDGVTNSYTLEIISMQKYQDIIDKTKTGRPMYGFIQNLANSTSLTLWPVTDKTYTLRYTGITRLRDWDNANDSNLIPERYLMALIYGLITYLGEDYKIPMGERDSYERKYVRYFNQAKKSDRNRDDNTFVSNSYGCK